MTLMILGILVLSITPFIVSSYIEYYRIYKGVQETFGLSDFYCVWEAFKDAFCDVFNIDPVDDEVDE